LIGGIDMTVVRNFFGGQINSSIQYIAAEDKRLSSRQYFIRAPIIKDCGKEARVLATLGPSAVAVQQNHLLATVFHSELEDELSWLCHFLRMVDK